MASVYDGYTLLKDCELDHPAGVQEVGAILVSDDFCTVWSLNKAFATVGNRLSLNRFNLVISVGWLDTLALRLVLLPLTI